MQYLIRREPLLTDAFFDEEVDFARETIEEFSDLLMNKEKVVDKPEILLFGIFSERYSLLSLEYSRGYPVADLLPDFVALVEALERYKAFAQAEDFIFNGAQDEYMQAVALLSLGLLLPVEQAVFARLVAALGLRGQDYVLEWLAGRRLPDRPSPSQLLFPKTYGRLRDALQAPRDVQAARLQSFLAGWYESLDTVWYNIHAHRLDAAGFTGYWCWEAAAAAYALGADDAELRALRYYPTDLADFARGRRPAAG